MGQSTWGVTYCTLHKMSVSYLHSAIPFLPLVCILSVVNAAGGPGGPGGPGGLETDQTDFIKAQFQHLSNMTKHGRKLSGVDLHQLDMFRLNVETAADGGRDGLSKFPGSPTIIIQANGEVRIKDKEGILLSQDGNVAIVRPSASQTELSSMEKLTKTSSTRSSHRTCWQS